MKTRKIVAALAAALLAALAFSACPSPTNVEESRNSTPPQIVPFMKMASIPAGTFMMGSPTTETVGNADERPQHNVTLSAFYIGKYQVTQAQWYEVMGTTIQEMQTATALPQNVSTDYGRGDDHPVYYVNWYQALVFCNKLSIKEGLSPAYSISGSTDPAVWGNVPTTSSNVTTWNAVVVVEGSNGYRLPTEAQWEYACRAGTTTAYNTGSNTINTDTGWYSANSENKTHKVGLKPANDWGLYDMHGNVWEWCWDWYGNTYYQNSAATAPDPAGPNSGTYRVMRGASFYDGQSQYFRSAYRTTFNNNYSYFGSERIGFRVVRPK